MRRALVVSAAFLVSFVVFVVLNVTEGRLGAAPAGAAEDAGAGGASLPACVQVGAEARYVPYGYNHVVVVKNGCSKPAACVVATDVNPQSTAVEVAAGSTVEVLTFTASPAQAFTPKVTCKLR